MRRSVAIVALLAIIATGCDLGASPVVETGSSAPTPPTSSGPVPTPAPPIWTGTILTRSDHRLYVGGTCSSDWKTTLSFTIQGNAASGTGMALLTSRGSPCPFPVAQVQIRRFEFAVTGELRAGLLELHLRDVRHTPSAGADDLGGFRSTTLSRQVRVKLDGDAARARVTLRAPDGERGGFTSVNVIRMRCKGC